MLINEPEDERPHSGFTLHVMVESHDGMQLGKGLVLSRDAVLARLSEFTPVSFPDATAGRDVVAGLHEAVDRLAPAIMARWPDA